MGPPQYLTRFSSVEQIPQSSPVPPGGSSAQQSLGCGATKGRTTGYLPYVAAPVVPLARLGDYSPDPAANATRVFVAKLRSLGIKAKLGEAATAAQSAPVLAQVSDNTVDDAVSVILPLARTAT